MIFGLHCNVHIQRMKFVLNEITQIRKMKEFLIFSDFGLNNKSINGEKWMINEE